MQLTLVIPALFRDDTTHLPTLHTPALNQLMRFGKFTSHPCTAAQLHARFLWNGSLLHHLLPRINMPSETPAIIVSPVWQQMEMNHISILEAMALHISEDEAKVLCQDLTQFYQQDDFQFHPVLPEIWLAVLPQKPQWQVPPVFDVYGQTNSGLQASGEQTKQWLTMQTEIQMFLHNHLINQSRANRKQPEINGIWLWQDTIGNRPQKILATNNIWAHLAQSDTQAAPYHLADFYANNTSTDLSDGIIFLDDLLATRHTNNDYAYQNFIEQYDHRYFAPAWEMLQTGKLKQLSIISDGNHAGSLCIKTKSRYAFWKLKKNFQGIFG